MIDEESKVMLITVIDREILTEICDSFAEAHVLMMTEFCAASGIDPKLCTEDELECDGEFGYCQWNAYVNDGPNHADYDWQIVVIK